MSEVPNFDERSLAKRLYDQLGDMAPIDTMWITTVKDHLPKLISTATKITIPKENMFHWNYRPAEFLLEQGLTKDYVWIFMYMNQLNNYQEFIGLTSVLIPDITTMNEIRELYKTSKQAETV